MIPIANPLADEQTSSYILKHVIQQKDNKNLITGIKACQKAICKGESNKIMIFTANTSPMDLITHIPILCEERNLPYIFVKDETYTNGFTCLLVDIVENDSEINHVLDKCWKSSENL